MVEDDLYQAEQRADLSYETPASRAKREEALEIWNRTHQEERTKLDIFLEGRRTNPTFGAHVTKKESGREPNAVCSREEERQIYPVVKGELVIPANEVPAPLQPQSTVKRNGRRPL